MQSNQCVSCIANSITDSWYILLNNLYEIAQNYDNANQENTSTVDNYATRITIGIINSSFMNLCTGVHENGKNNFESFMCISRNVLERLSNINYLNSKPENRIKYSKILKNNERDICELYLPADPIKKSTEWKSQKWTNISQEKRINALSSKQHILLYGYYSRVLHTLNIDILLKDEMNMTFIKIYTLLELVISYNTVLSVYHENSDEYNAIKTKHKEFNNLLNFTWMNKNLSLNSIILLTTFYDDKRDKRNSKVLKLYLKALKGSQKSMTFPEFVYVKHDLSFKHNNETIH